MIRLFLVLLLLLASCVPVIDHNDDPIPPVPNPPEEPVDIASSLSGRWNGHIFFTDGEEEAETMVVLFTLDLVNDDGDITGTVEFYTTMSDRCEVTGTQRDAEAELYFICQDVTSFMLTGAVDEGNFAGVYQSYTLYPDGDFKAVYVGVE